MNQPTPSGTAYRKRQKEWRSWIKNFRLAFPISGSSFKYTFIPEAAFLLNDMYWRLAEQYLRPILKTEKEEEEEHRIHPYKIIAASEIAVMMTEPIEVKDNPEENKKLNASFAWFVATQIIEGWDTGSPVKILSSHINLVAGYREHIDPVKKYPVSFAAEHINWLMALNPTIEKPLLLNSQCWRLFYFSCLAVAGKGVLK